MVESRPAENVNCLVSVENNNEAYIFILSHCFTQNVHIQIDRISITTQFKRENLSECKSLRMRRNDVKCYFECNIAVALMTHK